MATHAHCGVAGHGGPNCMISFSEKTRALLILSASVALAGALSGCNVFDPLDTPTNDVQLTTAARACFDQGDLTCARQYYNKLTKDSNDIKHSELAFATLDENGVGMGAFLDAFGGGGGGAGITNLSNRLAGSGKAVPATRLALYQAFQHVASIKNAGLRGLVRFTTATAIIAQIMSEGVGDNGKLDKGDYVANVTACAATTSTTCAASTDCNSIGGFLVAGANIDFENTTEAAVTGQTTVGMLNGAITQVDTALGGSEIGASGKFGTGAGSFASTLKNLGGVLSLDAGARCYRYQMLSLSIGGT